MLAADNAKICCWDQSSGELLREIKPGFGVASFVIPPDSESLIASPSPLNPMQFDLKTGRNLGQFVVPRLLARYPGSLSLDAAERKLVALSQTDQIGSRTLTQWDIATRQSSSQLKLPVKKANAFMLPSSSFIVAGQYVAEITSSMSQFDLLMQPITPLPGSIVLHSMADGRRIRTFTSCSKFDFCHLLRV